MKTVKFFYITLLGVLSFFSALATPKPPQPDGKEYIPPPPGEPLPIDENIFILLTIAVLYGIYIIYQHKVKEKTTT